MFLKQSTQTTVAIGPFVDATDAVTPETGVTLSGADQAEVLKGTTLVDISGATWSAISGANGWYSLTLTTGHTDTLGPLTVVVQDSSLCLPVRKEFIVMPAQEYDSLFGSDKLQVEVAEIASAARTLINNEIVDVMNTDTFSEPTGAPPATPTIRQMVHYLYQRFRNKTETDSTGGEFRVFRDDATTVNYEQDFTDAAGTLTVGEAGTPD